MSPRVPPARPLPACDGQSPRLKRHVLRPGADTTGEASQHKGSDTELSGSSCAGQVPSKNAQNHFEGKGGFYADILENNPRMAEPDGADIASPAANSKDASQLSPCVGDHGVFSTEVEVPAVEFLKKDEAMNVSDDIEQGTEGKGQDKYECQEEQHRNKTLTEEKLEKEQVAIAEHSDETKSQEQLDKRENPQQRAQVQMPETQMAEVQMYDEQNDQQTDVEQPEELGGKQETQYEVAEVVEVQQIAAECLSSEEEDTTAASSSRSREAERADDRALFPEPEESHAAEGRRPCEDVGMLQVQRQEKSTSPPSPTDCAHSSEADDAEVSYEESFASEDGEDSFEEDLEDDEE